MTKFIANVILTENADVYLDLVAQGLRSVGYEVEEFRDIGMTVVKHADDIDTFLNDLEDRLNAWPGDNLIIDDSGEAA